MFIFMDIGKYCQGGICRMKLFCHQAPGTHSTGGHLGSGALPPQMLSRINPYSPGKQPPNRSAGQGLDRLN